MRFRIATDEARPVVEHLTAHLRAKGHQVTLLPVGPWAEVSLAVAHAVAHAADEGRVEQGIVCCWTGTGASIAANKVRGVRAALCVDAETAAGARRWNDANVLALSLRRTTEALAVEIADAWLAAAYEGEEKESLARVAAEERA